MVLVRLAGGCTRKQPSEGQVGSDLKDTGKLEPQVHPEDVVLGRPVGSAPHLSWGLKNPWRFLWT